MKAKSILSILALTLLLTTLSPVKAQEDISSEWIIEVQKDGDAKISVKILIPVESQELWDELSKSIDEEMLSSYQQILSEMLTDVLERTGREMSIHSWNMEKNFADDHGEITISFLWENFCSSEDGKLKLDVLEGFVIPEGTSLIIRAPEGMSFSEISPAPDEITGSSVIYKGSKTLGSVSMSLSTSKETPGFELAAALMAALLVSILLKVSSRR
ncbi:MAG: DUF4897 domain-containing protein [Archaeoglobi archaeon]|nr:DUF4897 domain-containing protein [Candidatus Mnemosynella sp.]